ncbi:ATP-dependent nuclease [Azospirillum argentinense]
MNHWSAPIHKHGIDPARAAQLHAAAVDRSLIRKNGIQQYRKWYSAFHSTGRGASMKLGHIRIKNLRSFEDAEVPVNDYTCLVGANGAGKSTVLCALNVFFRETENASTDMTRLDREDFFRKETDRPIEITLTFTDLSPEAQEDFKDYYRNGKLIVTAKAIFNPETEKADVRQYGNRLGFEAFRPFFEALGNNASAADLKVIYTELRDVYDDLPKPGSKDAMTQALREYETARPEGCVLIPSDDQFYGFSKGVNKLSRYIQWVYIPAVKDAASEQVEAKDTALGKLLARTVRAKTNFTETVGLLRQQVRDQYQQLLEANQHVLDGISTSLRARLAEWAHPDALLQLRWRQDPDKSVKLEEPWAHVMAGEGEFLGELARLGHGLQRSYLIALLQELAAAGGADGPRLLLGCEEPELYQHPPQARYLAEVLRSLSEGNAQVMASTHSPFFVSGEAFEDVRVVRRDRTAGRSSIAFASFEDVSASLAEVTGKPALKREGALAKVHQTLQPALAEMFFTPRLILVEGLEDVAYIHTYLQLLNKWSEFRKAGCHIVPTNKKSEMPQPLAIARKLHIPTFVVFDSDAATVVGIKDEKKQEEQRNLHYRDNSTLLKLCKVPVFDPLPPETFWGEGVVMWHANMGDTVAAEIGTEAWRACQAEANKAYGHAGDLKKNTLHIGASLTSAWEKGHRSSSLERLISEILAFATGDAPLIAAPAADAVAETAAA